METAVAITLIVALAIVGVIEIIFLIGGNDEKGRNINFKRYGTNY